MYIGGGDGLGGGLVERMQSGDKTAMDEIIRLYYNDVYCFLCRKLPTFAQAQDMTQDVFMRLTLGIHRYQERGKLRNYLLQMALNACRDYYRRCPPDPLNVDDIADTLPGAPLPGEVYEAREQGERVRAVLQSLPDFQKDVIILRFYHDLAFKDIARITGANLSATKSRYKQGMDKLKRLLEEAVEDA
ncbi:sigma-70 family RNA polymerase sigma factor [Eubacteriales bacterium OttesenSCG-928-A19]|nr:sigma-70 family RNA polymerase sigma factor [Eubacteriales bacterium OttesenSCG-928-A19]